MTTEERARRVRTSAIVGAAVLIAALALGLGPDGARGANPTGVSNTPSTAPADPNDSSGRVLLRFDACPHGSRRCPRRVIRKMKQRWRPIDRRCGHRAVFALTYLRTTREFARTERRRPHFFSDVHWINHEDAVFARLYFRAVKRYYRGRPVPAAWKTAFDAASSPDVTGIGDLLLGMNAHINRDLPFALAHVGLVKRDGSSRKPDHDKVNTFLDRVIDPLQTELARRYDPLFGYTDAEPSPFDEAAALQAVRGFRENAWRNAERLVNATSAAERKQVADSIEAEAESGAESILASNTVPGYGPSRDAYCRAAHGG